MGVKSPWHDGVIKWKHFPRYLPFVKGIHRSPVDSLHKGQWRGALMFSLICDYINSWVNNREAGDLRRHNAHYDVTVIINRSSLNWTRMYRHVWDHWLPDALKHSTSVQFKKVLVPGWIFQTEQPWCFKAYFMLIQSKHRGHSSEMTIESKEYDKGH